MKWQMAGTGLVLNLVCGLYSQNHPHKFKNLYGDLHNHHFENSSPDTKFNYYPVLNLVYKNC